MRDQLIYSLRGKGAHMSFDEAVADFPVEAINAKAPGVDYSFWHLIEHLRICQWDILEFSRNAAHVSPEFPAGYWPQSIAPPSATAWDESVERFLADRNAMEALIRDANSDLFAPFPWGDGQNLLREATLIADHNAYHIGQAIAVRRLLDCWNG